MNKLELFITSVRDNLHLVEGFIENIVESFELKESIRGKITLSTIEAVNNAILSGNKENPEKLVKLTAEKEKEKVVITVEDEGEGFDFKNIPDPTIPENLMKTNGRGVYLMIHLTDELLFAKNGAKVVMTFFLNS
ncbi:ATP-binding protein [Chryseobacterium sp.]|uniref:ATP-binding protein n=1 Tax=Chryseobacterium sp. TaxID=1871047 RepID=UPI002FC5DA19